MLSGSVSLPLERVMVMVMTEVAKKSWRKERPSRIVTVDAIGRRILVGFTVRFANQKENESLAWDALCSVDRQVHLRASQLPTSSMN